MNTIIATNKPTKNTSNVWMVSMTEDDSVKQYCKSAYNAMRFMFGLKKSTGVRIEDESLKALSAEIARIKTENAAKIQTIAEEFSLSHSVDNVLDQPIISDEECERLGINPIVANAVFLPSEPFASEPVAPAPKRRGRPRKNKTTEEAA